MKARIAPHGNEDPLRHGLKRDCSMCIPVGFRVLLSKEYICKWRITKLYVRSEFLQMGAASREVYVVPPRESQDRGSSLWLILTTAY